MKTSKVTELPGEKMRKAIDAFCELQRQYPGKTRVELLERVSQQFDLSPLECEFLRRQLKDD